MFRSILETSYGIFSIDLILFCSCIAIITKNKEINKDEFQFEFLIIFFILNLFVINFENIKFSLNLLLINRINLENFIKNQQALAGGIIFFL